eukprot:CAMPEP_0182443688 /NCGR_PEP_ID=MMETSP1172-20130603/2358_1 /TAXON_ID=708627 /ORGANISM="Timspurckia oligopyrenoides, Strain CCMP3278" /LENGTH=222 /DNA_ID=CAMNT_0024639043 /DNA_START=207 /DNA_END=872 /DNA_ORIENTATION=+
MECINEIDEFEALCRICYGEEGNEECGEVLIRPCGCGTPVHSCCLEKWIHRKNEMLSERGMFNSLFQILESVASRCVLKNSALSNANACEVCCKQYDWDDNRRSLEDYQSGGCPLCGQTRMSFDWCTKWTVLSTLLFCFSVVSHVILFLSVMNGKNTSVKTEGYVAYALGLNLSQQILLGQTLLDLCSLLSATVILQNRARQNQHGSLDDNSGSSESGTAHW